MQRSRTTWPVLLAAGLTLQATAQNDPPTDTVTFDAQALLDSIGNSYIDSIERSFTWQHGEIPVAGVATLHIPEGFKFLDEAQTRRVLVDLWGNPNADGCLGMIFPEHDGVLQDGGFAFVVQYEDIGHVEDGDADDIDYDELLASMKKDEVEENKQRAEAGFDPAYTLGWALPPYYDKENKVLHWAKEIQFGDSAATHTLNYNVRVLGRKGVLNLNAVASMDELDLVKKHVPDVLGIVKFDDGHRYDQFDSNVDEVAAMTIGGLVAGKVLAKAGIFALLAKFGGKILLVLGAAGAGLWRFFGGRKKNDAGGPPAAPPQA